MPTFYGLGNAAVTSSLLFYSGEYDSNDDVFYPYSLNIIRGIGVCESLTPDSNALLPNVWYYDRNGLCWLGYGLPLYSDDGWLILGR